MQCQIYLGYIPGFLVVFIERSKNRTPVFGSIFGTISVTSQIPDSRFFMCMTMWSFFGIHGSGVEGIAPCVEVVITICIIVK